MKDLLNRLFNQERLTSAEAKAVLLDITRGKYSDPQIAALLACLNMRGVTPDELIGFREALMTTCVPVNLDSYAPIDIVGTGGDGKNTFNVSTCACFVVAGAGYNVAKHGNYGASSVSGASNVMELHGVKFSADPALMQRSMDECHIVYMHAQLFNPGMKSVGPVRAALQVRTVFNLLGPLVNPCKPKYQLLGVATLSQMRLYTAVLQRLGISFTIASSVDGYDEISLTGEFKIASNTFEKTYLPSDLGLTQARPEELSGGATPQEAASIFDHVLEGTATPGQRDCVLATAAFGIQTMAPQKPLADCLAAARESLESGAALRTFRKYVELNS